MRWIIGDVHGMLKPLEALLNQIRRIDPEAALYFLGDYVNRGPESQGVIELLLTLENAKFLRGNHDDVFDQILHGVSYAENPSRGDRIIAFQWFMDHGIIETMLSYGATRDMIYRVVSRRTREDLNLVIDLVPQTHRQFIRSLQIFIEDQDLFVVHGKWPMRETSTPAALLEGSFPPAALRHEVMWGRFTSGELQHGPAWPKRGFFGHTPVQTYVGHEDDHRPILTENIVLLDTAAALLVDGRLTAFCPDTNQMIQAHASGRLIENA